MKQRRNQIKQTVKYGKITGIQFKTMYRYFSSIKKKNIIKIINQLQVK